MMTFSRPQKTKMVIRPLQYRDLEAIEALISQFRVNHYQSYPLATDRRIEQVRNWYGILRFLRLFPNPYRHHLCIYVAEQNQELCGLIQVKPFNSTRSTWKVEYVLVDDKVLQQELVLAKLETGSQLLRHCLETIWEARTWVLEVNVNDQSTLGLYRQNGFQPLAQMTYWGINPELIGQLAQQDPDLPNLLPVSNADAQLIYQLDTVSMPPHIRQVFDRHVQDFKTSLTQAVFTNLQHRYQHTEVIKGYVFEPLRKAAIGYFELESCNDGSRPHKAKLSVNPAYTWLYPKIISQMAQIVHKLPPQSLQLASADYQPEREEYLHQLGAEAIDETLLMSRSVWHKLRETKRLEGLQWSDMLQSLQPARTPIPTRISRWRLHPPFHYHHSTIDESARSQSRKGNKERGMSSE